MTTYPAMDGAISAENMVLRLVARRQNFGKMKTPGEEKTFPPFSGRVVFEAKRYLQY